MSGGTITVFDLNKHKQNQSMAGTLTPTDYNSQTDNISSMSTYSGSIGAAWEQGKSSGKTTAANNYVNRVVDLAKTTGRFVRNNRETIALIVEIASKFYK
ncbi:MAG TPA: hypothetical protein VLF93_00740 [Candidatus Saccharimonadales bacterium]|nr:hypothetical protein [Candidatus Saccharimonadales bacterium]